MRMISKVMSLILAMFLLIGCACAEEATEVFPIGFNAVDHTPVTSEIFKENTVTMLNVWATYCNPCIQEMPELAKLQEAYADRGVRIVGVLSDVGLDTEPDEEALQMANMIIERTGADCLHLVPNDILAYSLFANLTAVPTTFFVTSEGVIPFEPLVGSRNFEQWSYIMDQVLEVLAQ